ncbi:hypothetical protein N7539_006548 [Penicillium diatomitis]|uniref:Carrier domain-containing protein n=1 Tax=Penicillium diatomitis TaxID=2819901 RepID=A0A9W9X369_9EURO|nr:uncharacterized protein N7539_006548 [Penicillium diatomitis]KAJ5483102.1 hypothetical protein N7539_006548 [Penicillium diatomitis]
MSEGSADSKSGLAEPAFYFHTSGTSTGLPSPIPQSHSMIKALPCFQKNNQTATFSTTPLYHGGLADCLRAWTSGAMMWCFPEGKFPLTAGNIVQVVNYAREADVAPVKFFSSVPYVLQMMMEDERGLQILSSMDLVGVGGAAMPVATGNRLIQLGINLLSRFGSAECGFLLSSHRDYKNDQEWEYLRVHVTPEFLQFEPRDGGLSELVVKPMWPFRSKTNRDDGSYATADLFEPHPSRNNLWRYHSRADSQITLANGKKFDPAPLEQELQSATPLLRDVYVFGTGQVCAGALLFPSSDVTPEELLHAVNPVLTELNARSPPHARVEESMVVVVSSSAGATHLPKSSKGSILRHQADVMFSNLIESAYSIAPDGYDASPIRLDVTDLLHELLQCFHRVLHRPVDPDQDLYQQGVDSIACIQVRKIIERKRLVPVNCKFPLNIIYDQGTVRGLATYVDAMWDPSAHRERAHDAQFAYMESLADKYDVQPPRRPHGKLESANATIVITGATGFLGAYILGLLRQRPIATRRICCLVRARTVDEAHERVSECQAERGFHHLPRSTDEPDEEQSIVCLPFETDKPRLGLDEGTWQELVHDTALIIHGAWPVNFNLPLSSYDNQFACVAALLALAGQSDAHFVFISSVAAAVATDQSTIKEAISNDPAHAAPLGYARSKWVAERICAKFNQAFDGDTPRSVASIIRIGQLCGDTLTGAWNRSEAYPLMFSASTAVGALPDLDAEGTNWLPVDVAARSVLEIAFARLSNDHSESSQTQGVEHSNATLQARPTPVFHVANPHDSTPWRQVLQWISSAASLMTPPNHLHILPASDWVDRVEHQLSEDHHARSLLGFWRQSYAGTSRAPRVVRKPPRIEITRARALAESMSIVGPMDQQTADRLWRWVQLHV